MVLANLIWPFRVHYDVWFFSLVLDVNCPLWPHLWHFFQFFLDLYAAWWLWHVLVGSGQIKIVLPLLDGFCKFIMALDSSLRCSRWFWPVRNSFCCFWMVLSGIILLLMVLFGVWMFWPFTYGSFRFWYDPSFPFTSFYIDLDAAWWYWTVLDGFLPVQDCRDCYSILQVGSMWLLMILFGFGLFWPVQDCRCRLWYDLSYFFSSCSLI